MVPILSSLGDDLVIAMSDQTLWTNIAKTVIFILLGFLFTKKKWLPETTGKVLTKFVMGVCLPCLAFCSFMKSFSVTEGVGAIVNFILGFVFYIGFIFLGKLVFLWVKDKSKRDVLALLFAFGSTTFFSYPLVNAIYGPTAGNYFNIMNVAYRVFLYSYAYLVASGTTLFPKKKEESAIEEDPVGEQKKEEHPIRDILKRVFLNPILIATFAGLLLWVLQAIPSVNFITVNPYTGAELASPVAFWRLDVTVPWIFQAANTLGNISSTLILFAIGCTLGSGSLAAAVSDWRAWVWTAIKVLVAPAVALGVLFGVQAIAIAAGHSEIISIETVQSTVFTWLAPAATVAVGYCINFDKEKEMASHISLVSTFGAVIGVVIWVVILVVVKATGFFYVG
ncbi:MAG: AEC family transporter [Bacilli bacterium]|nr:AEC family transporter [Bacilli bacterium]